MTYQSAGGDCPTPGAAREFGITVNGQDIRLDPFGGGGSISDEALTAVQFDTSTCELKAVWNMTAGEGSDLCTSQKMTFKLDFNSSGFTGYELDNNATCSDGSTGFSDAAAAMASCNGDFAVTGARE